MILTGPEIRRQVQQKRIQIDPFDSSQVNPNSYDLRLGKVLGSYEDHVLDAARDNAMSFTTMDASGTVLSPGQIVLGHSVEVVGSDHYVPIVRAKSSVARLGLFIHVTADLIDIGSHGQLTFQFHAVQPVRVYPSMLVAQVTFWVPRGEIILYSGKYQGSNGPVASKIAMDVKQGEIA